MTIAEVTKLEESASIIDTVKALSQRSFPESDLRQILKEINIDLHDVMNPTLRPDKPVYAKAERPKVISAYQLDGKVDTEPQLVRVEPINRINLAFQEIICNKRVSFCLANPVVRTYTGLKKTEEEQLEEIRYALEKIYFDNKIASHAREAARNVFTYTEVAEYWYPQETKERFDRYGYDTNQKIKVALYTRENGYKFYPLKDANGDMICFSMEYKVKEQGKIVTYFESWTDQEHGKWKRSGGYLWTQVFINPHKLGKIPIVFGWQMHPEYRNATAAIARLETLLSNHAEINDYHSGPKIFLKNADSITGFGSKGSASMVLQGKGEADAKYLTWDFAVESVKLEIDTLLSTIYNLTSTPNINFENIKGLGAMSGVSIKLLFMDAHLAVKDKESVLLDMEQRRNSIVCGYVKLFNPGTPMAKCIDRVEINSALVPFMIADDKEEAEIIQIKNGMMPVLSQETSVTLSGGDKEEFERITKETTDREVRAITEPTGI